MSKSKDIVKFETTLVTSAGKPVYHFLLVEKEWVAPLGFTGNIRRVVCTMNGVETIQCSLLPTGKGAYYYISLNKTIRDKLGISVGDKVDVELTRDESKYGLPMPEEFAEVLKQDAAGDRLFHGLTAGKQRSILYQLSKPKDIDLRIHQALLIVEHLKENGGKIIDKILFEELKRPMF